MLPLQNPDVNHNNRGRRAIILLFIIAAFMLFMQGLQEGMDTEGIDVPNTSICDDLKLNIPDMLGFYGNVTLNDTIAKECAAFLILDVISQRNFRGTWQDADQSGNFFLQAYRTINHKSHEMILRLLFFEGEYLDDSHIVMTLLFNETNHSQITYEKSKITFENQPVRYQEVGDSSTQQECTINMVLDLTNLTSTETPIPQQLIVLASIDATRCKAGDVIKATAQLQHRVLNSNSIKDYQHKSFLYSCYISTIAMIQIMATLRMLKQLFESNVQAEHYSLLSLAFITAQDSYMSILHFYLALNFEIFFHQFITPAFLYFLLFSVFEMRLLIIAWKMRQEVIKSASIEYFVDNRQLREGLIKFYVAYYTFIFIMSYMLYQFAMRAWFMILMSLFLVPQIVHTAQRGQHQLMNRTYAYGLMASRLLVVLYYRGCRTNMFEFRPNYLLCFVCTLLVVVQILVYYFQERKGPRFFIPKAFLPKRFEYFVEIPDTIDLEHGVSQEVQTLFADECAVCMNPLHSTPALQLSEVEQLNVYLNQILREGKGKIMRTPCEHKFHTMCLAKWMNVKMTCPSCRRSLPAI